MVIFDVDLVCAYFTLFLLSFVGISLHIDLFMMDLCECSFIVSNGYYFSVFWNLHTILSRITNF
jgi:uncharacterized membrane protein